MPKPEPAQAACHNRAAGSRQVAAVKQPVPGVEAACMKQVGQNTASPAAEQVLSSIQSGQRTAFDSLFLDHANTVYRYCCLRTGFHEGEDLMSVVFLEAWAHRHRAFLVEDSILPWLLGIARNVCRMRSRSLRRHRGALAQLVTLAADEPDPADDVAERLDRCAMAQRLSWALGELTRRERDVVLMCLIEGLSPAAAAQALGVPVGTVKSTLARARSRMQKQLRWTGEHTDPSDLNGNVTSEQTIPAPGLRIGTT